MAKKPIPAFTVSLSKACAFRHSRQGLADPAAAAGRSPEELIARTGWARALGGIDVYLGVCARRSGTTREDLDGAARRGELRVIPAVRGCIYLAPRRDTASLMALAAELQRPRTSRDLEKVESSWEEVEDVAAGVLEALRGGPLNTQALRKALPEGLVRSYGAAGKKVGLSSPLPVALRELEFRTRIVRRPIEDRLDTERYDWRLIDETKQEEATPDEHLLHVVERFLRFFAPISRKELAAWIGIPQRDAQTALEDLPVLPVEIEGEKDPAWIFEEDAVALREASPADGLSFLPFEDNLLTVYGGPGIWTDPAYRDVPIESWGNSKPTPLSRAKHVGRRPLMLGPDLVGFWEVDLEGEEIVVGTFEPLPKTVLPEFERRREELLVWIRDDLGHARSFSMDTEEKIRARVRLIREMGVAS